MIYTWLNRKIDDEISVILPICFIIGTVIGILVAIFSGGLIWGVTTSVMVVMVPIGFISGGVGLLVIPFYFLALLFGYSIVNSVGVFACPLWILLIISIVVVEIIFWSDKDKPKSKDSKLWFAVEKKFECIGDVFFGLMIVNAFIHLGIVIVEYFGTILEALKWIGIVALVVLGIIGYFAINSLKYRKR